MPKRKRASVSQVANAETPPLPIPPLDASSKKAKKRGAKTITNPEEGQDVVDAASALRASPDGEVNKNIIPAKVNGVAGASTKKEEADQMRGDPEDEEDIEADPEEIKLALARPPPVNSSYLPLPWKGRIGYACLNTYLRTSNPPVFCSRTTRIASILEHRHPLKDPTQPEHATKNRPDKDKPADIRLGQQFVENLCLANIRDMAKLIRWNDKYNIKFLRLSSEAFPFASHAEYGYKLAPFAADALAEVGRVAAELGHRLTTHPGQFTQLGSPRKQVIDNAIRDLEYHAEMLDLLKLPPQQDRDAIMVLHMGGTFGSKSETLDRFRENYARLPANVKKRLVLENDDMCWSVHDLLPVCQELNIPFVLDFHHHNIIFDADKIREGTYDIMELYPAIRETWTKKGITMKMHYSEPTPAAITGKQRRKHSPRVKTLPPCPDDVDLMIEAKDKEQAVLELMRIFKLPGWDKFNDVIPYTREDDDKSVLATYTATVKKMTPKKKGKKAIDDDENGAVKMVMPAEPTVIPDEEIAMGGPHNRVYWPPGMEEWLRPKKRVVKKKGEAGGEDEKEKPTPKKAKKEKSDESVNGPIEEPIVAPNGVNGKRASAKPAAKAKPVTKVKPASKASKKTKQPVEESEVSEEAEESEESEESEEFLEEKEEEAELPARKKGRGVVKHAVTTPAKPTVRGLGRRASARSVNYADSD